MAQENLRPTPNPLVAAINKQKLRGWQADPGSFKERNELGRYINNSLTQSQEHLLVGIVTNLSKTNLGIFPDNPYVTNYPVTLDAIFKFGVHQTIDALSTSINATNNRKEGVGKLFSLVGIPDIVDRDAYPVGIAVGLKTVKETVQNVVNEFSGDGTGGINNFLTVDHPDAQLIYLGHLQEKLQTAITELTGEGMFTGEENGLFSSTQSYFTHETNVMRKTISDQTMKVAMMSTVLMLLVAAENAGETATLSAAN